MVMAGGSKRSIFSAAYVALALSGCQPDPSETQIDAKLLSPDRRLTAVYAEDLSGGPTTGVSEDVYIVDGDRFPRVPDRVFSNECVHGIVLKWVGPRELRIDFNLARDISVDTSRGGQSPLPWLWGKSLADEVHVRLVRHLTPAGEGC